MTTPSETRAGKLRLDASIIKEASTVLEAVGASGVVLPDNWRWPLTDELAGIALEALAASEPDMRDAYEGAREDLLDWKGRAQRAEARLRALGWTGIDASERPAPEQPGKGEVVTMEPLTPTSDRMIRVVTAAPQPSDPAEGDALRALIADWRERAKNGPGALNVAAKELEAALSTPPTAAVRIDDAMVERAARGLHITDDCCFTTWDELPEYGQSRYRDKARAALTAALDPQVKK